MRYSDALACVEAPSVAAALRRSLDLHPLGDWTDDARKLCVLPQDAYPEHAGPLDYTRAVLSPDTFSAPWSSRRGSRKSPAPRSVVTTGDSCLGSCYRGSWVPVRLEARLRVRLRRQVCPFGCRVQCPVPRLGHLSVVSAFPRHPGPRQAPCYPLPLDRPAYPLGFVLAAPHFAPQWFAVHRRQGSRVGLPTTRCRPPPARPTGWAAAGIVRHHSRRECVQSPEILGPCRERAVGSQESDSAGDIYYINSGTPSSFDDGVISW